MGLTGAQAVVDPQMLEAVVKDTLNATAPRTMVVLSPLKVTIGNLPPDAAATIDVPDFPTEPHKGSHTISFDKVIYIDRSDFREVVSIPFAHSHLTTVDRHIFCFLS